MYVGPCVGVQGGGGGRARWSGGGIARFKAQRAALNNIGRAR